MKASFLPPWVAFSLLLAGVQPALSNPTISINPTNEANNISLDGQGNARAQIVKVATLNISTPNPNGFTLTINSSTLANAKSRNSIAFQVGTVASGESCQNPGIFSTAPGQTYTFNGNSGSSLRALCILYAPTSLPHAGTYNAVINVSVTDR